MPARKTGSGLPKLISIGKPFSSSLGRGGKVKQQAQNMGAPSNSFWTKLKHFFTLETKWTAVLLMSPIVIFLLCTTVFPTIYALIISLQSYNLADVAGREFIGLGNFTKLFADSQFWNAMKVTGIFLSGSLFFEMILGFCLALLISKNFRGNRLVKTIFLLPTVTTPVVVGLIWVMMYDAQFGVINYFLTSVGLSPQDWLANSDKAIWALIVVDIWEWTPFVALVILAGLQSLPTEPYEAARVDGASSWQMFRHVTLPMVKHYVIVAFIFRFMDAFRWFDTIYVMTKGGPGTATQTLNMFGYFSAFEYLNMGYAAAIGIVMLIMMILISQVFVKSFLLRKG